MGTNKKGYIRMDAEKLEHIPVFYACDDRYIPLAAASVASMLFNTRAFIDLYILDCKLSEKNKKKFLLLQRRFNNFSVQFIRVDSDTQFGHIELRNYLTTACFARFLIPQLVPNVNRCIYLDCDTILFGDIAGLWNQELGDFMLGAVPDPNVFNNPDKKSLHYAAALLSDTHLYFNSGVLLIDCEKWRKYNIYDKLIESEQKTAKTRIFNDQDVLNNAFDSNYCPLDVRFNVKSNLVTFCPQENICIRHFTGQIKPWLKMGFLQLNAHDFWFYCQMTPFFAETLINGLTELGTVDVRKL